MAHTGSARRWSALAAMVLCVLVIGLDSTILFVALPTLSADLGATTSELQWIADSYVVVFAALLLPAGVIGDRFGRRRLLLAGVAVFGAASAWAAFTDTAGGLIAARAAMGVGAAVLVPLTMSMLPVLFAPAERTRAVGIWAAGLALGLPLGPILGGYLLEHYWWGSVFLVNVPVTAVAFVLAAVLLPSSRDESASRVDGVGAVLSVAGLTALVYGIIEAPADGWDAPGVYLPIAAGALLLAALGVWCSRVRRPVIDLALLRDRTFLWGATAATLVTFVLTGVLFTLPQYLQAVGGFDALDTGVRLIPFIAGIMAGALPADRLAARVGAKRVIVTGLVVLTGALAWATATDVDSPYGMVAAWLTVAGVGSGLALTPAMDAVMGTLDERRTGGGSGLAQAMRQVGGALAVAVLGSVLSAAYAGRLPAAASETARDSIVGALAEAGATGDAAALDAARIAYAHGMSVVLWVCAGLTLLGTVLVALRFPRRPAGDRGDVAESAHAGIA